MFINNNNNYYYHNFSAELVGLKRQIIKVTVYMITEYKCTKKLNLKPNTSAQNKTKNIKPCQQKNMT